MFGHSGQFVRMNHGDVNGVEFSPDGSRILTWSNDGTASLWDFGVDYDFPVAHLPLQVEVMTGTTMNDHGAVSALSTEEWKRKKRLYDRIAENHAAKCQYKKANLYLQKKR
ncbi:MAG: hypothetical protein BECKG1743D_GA0114223_104975 [Candidatus Kentron sp. G]|nr:MAG: hypothetical protein BECKG1743F_GA0114225_104585 [Candidatus Kentron sp. G]VFN01295.1 MAG: hypothetical protein BECKG1743E_GA0114224_103967 [Candidatus Kentron sp. G]VFN03646.1 MAG: hypothetical protein BECKG1743D_GA0114223_104975 [Candidatus Kentron sp. G]